MGTCTVGLWGTPASWFILNSWPMGDFWFDFMPVFICICIILLFHPRMSIFQKGEVSFGNNSSLGDINQSITSTLETKAQHRLVSHTSSHLVTK